MDLQTMGKLPMAIDNEHTHFTSEEMMKILRDLKHRD
jgi:hypothetical protein